MSDETFSILRRLDGNAAEIQSVFQCAPVLTGLKISNLLHIREEQSAEVFRLFEDSPISCQLLCRWDGRVSILLYRKGRLSQYLQKSDVKALMLSFGYDTTKPDTVLKMLAVRYQAYVEDRAAFPHEIGLLLGYPPEDVTGFIENQGKNFLYSGYWKVYGDPEQARRIFEGYDRAREAAVRMAGNGMGVKDILAYYNIMRCRQLTA